MERQYRAFAQRHGVEAEAIVRSAIGRRMADVLTDAVPSLRGRRLRDECAAFKAAEAADVGCASAADTTTSRRWSTDVVGCRRSTSY